MLIIKRKKKRTFQHLAVGADVKLLEPTELVLQDFEHVRTSPVIAVRRTRLTKRMVIETLNSVYVRTNKGGWSI